jgi:hypothetical protein
LNGSPVADPRRLLAAGDFNADGIAELSSGRKRHVLLKLA